MPPFILNIPSILQHTLQISILLITNLKNKNNINLLNFTNNIGITYSFQIHGYITYFIIWITSVNLANLKELGKAPFQQISNVQIIVHIILYHNIRSKPPTLTNSKQPLSSVTFQWLWLHVTKLHKSEIFFFPQWLRFFKFLEFLILI